MSASSQNIELQTRFDTQWGSTTPVAWPNVAFTPPNPQVPWVRFTILTGEELRLSFGATLNNYRTVGIITIQVFTELNKGNAQCLALADQAAAVFRGWCGASITCRAATVKEIGPDGQGWFQCNVNIVFKRDELL